MADDAVILVFAKAPMPGEVKTRMIPAMGAEGAAMLHAALAERVLQTAHSTGADVVLCAAPDATHPFFEDCADEFDVALAEQTPDADLGLRMLHALDEALAEWDRAILIGADCPAFTKKHLAAAMAQLADHDVVLTPADDGGYVLVGARRTAPGMFDNIDWGTDQVLDQQRRALGKAELDWHEMETLWDVDRPGDLARLKTLKPPLEFFWPT
jgi:hypothetical protein